ncbi:MAG TPA: CRTAC1 family protein [Armatimonadota bacterium]|nr:CRTAC1 family protein [Armatimonadota bacterium]
MSEIVRHGGSGRSRAWFACALLFGAAFLSATGCAPHTGKSLPPRAAAPGPLFADVASSAGLHYRWPSPVKRPLNILQTIGNGCAFLDYNNDGNLDILLVGPRLGLYRGDGKGHFTDVTSATGLSKFSGDFLGCAVGDIDGDGYDDIFVTGYRTDLLLHNDSGRGFHDITRQSGITPQPWSTSCAFAETVSGSGNLDLYVDNYADFGPRTVPQLCTDHGLKTSCGPRYYTPIKGVLYRNDGHGHFTDVTAQAGLTAAKGRGLGVAFADFDGSGIPGIAVENDEEPGDLFQGRRKGNTVVYTDIGEASGTAYDRDGNVHGAMGTDWGDYDNDGKLDLLVATFQHDTKCLYHNEGAGEFTEMGLPTGLGSVTQPYVAFGCKLFDYDNDGWLDVVIANGHVQDNIHAIDPSTTYRQDLQLLHNSGRTPVRFKDVSASSGPAFRTPIVGRGLAVGDYDNDGRLDLLVVDSEGKPLLLHNQSTSGNHWLGVRLIGTTSNRDGYGAMLTARVGARSYLRHCHADGSYLSSSDPRVHFGLGAARQVDSLTIRWPDGSEQTLNSIPADRYITVREIVPLAAGGGKPKPGGASA